MAKSKTETKIKSTTEKVKKGKKEKAPPPPESSSDESEEEVTTKVAKKNVNGKFYILYFISCPQLHVFLLKTQNYTAHFPSTAS